MRDHALRPATVLPPPLIYAVALLGAWWLDSQLSLALDLAAAYLGWALIALGFAGFAWALSAIWGNHTTVNPYKAATSLVTSGPFRYSRNPIYVSDWLVYVGVMLLMQTAWPLLFAPVVWGVMRYAVIAHEEAHLEAKFGGAYRDYTARVRRWF
ncbi:MAG: isoprenylcysteine carboxylmethyltransferase family protein [Hydrogenophilales bacterium]|nr:isoprenylcysteine carboxylmethyltransferase family protein [Hydrogenophilales bacterium]